MRPHSLLIAAALVAWPLASRAQTLGAVRASGHLECGVVQGVDDWNGEDLHGDLSAFEGEICRAVAAAILGDADTAEIHDFPGELEALRALKSGSVQLAVGVSPTTSAAMQLGIAFGRPVYYDSQRILVARQSGIRDLEGLRDKLICARSLTPPEQTLRDELTARGIPYALQSHSEQGEMDAAIAVIRCKAGTGMETRLAQSRANFHARVSDFFFLPDRWALSPMVVAAITNSTRTRGPTAARFWLPRLPLANTATRLTTAPASTPDRPPTSAVSSKRARRRAVTTVRAATAPIASRLP